jgi:hypothetical protein
LAQYERDRGDLGDERRPSPRERRRSGRWQRLDDRRHRRLQGGDKADILWRNTNGTVVIWEMNGGQLLESVGGQIVSAFLWTLVQ